MHEPGDVPETPARGIAALPLDDPLVVSMDSGTRASEARSPLHYKTPRPHQGLVLGFTFRPSHGEALVKPWWLKPWPKASPRHHQGTLW